jgi:hypothetical protein
MVDGRIQPLKHGYTNQTLGDGAVVEKTYAGPDAEVRRERDVLVELEGRLPVPPVRGMTHGVLRLGLLEGSPGQDLLDAGQAEAVLTASGQVLSCIHRTTVTSLAADGVLVHGDFRPNNPLLDPVTFAVTAVVDWEFAHYGEPVEDLAWCEWIVRMHHPVSEPPCPASSRRTTDRCRAGPNGRPRWSPAARSWSGSVSDGTVQASTCGGNAARPQQPGLNRPALPRSPLGHLGTPPPRGPQSNTGANARHWSTGWGPVTPVSTLIATWSAPASRCSSTRSAMAAGEPHAVSASTRRSSSRPI